MFNPEDFKLPLESQLKQRIIVDEIRDCEDIKELRSQLVEVVKQLMTYQHLLNATLKKVVETDLKNSVE